ncbi:MAG: DUF5665 domain-containing protein [Bacillaceae bacterium]|nr:DUF5665 domain-containing protein [Bacillaceae bacterium]
MKKSEEELEKILNIIEKHGQTIEKVEKLDDKLDRIGIALEKSKINDILLNYTNPHRVFWINILVGIGRGLGLTIGTVIVLSLLGLILQQFVDLPLIGEWIRDLINYVELPELKTSYLYFLHNNVRFIYNALISY